MYVNNGLKYEHKGDSDLALRWNIILKINRSGESTNLDMKKLFAYITVYFYFYIFS